jgi:hypothetical protein
MSNVQQVMDSTSRGVYVKGFSFVSDRRSFAVVANPIRLDLPILGKAKKLDTFPQMPL